MKRTLCVSIFWLGLFCVYLNFVSTRERGKRLSQNGAPKATELERLRELEDRNAQWSRLLSDAKQDYDALSQQLKNVKEYYTRIVPRNDDGPEHGLPSLKIFVYEMPPKFNQDVLELNPKCGFEGSQNEASFQVKYANEVYMHKALLDSSMRTNDPEKADLFYIPIYVTCFLHDHRGLLGLATDFAREGIAWVQQNHDHFNRSLGRDHVVTVAHDIGGCLLDFALADHIILITNTGEMGDRLDDIRIYAKNLDPGFALQHLHKRCFSPWKDIVVPPYISSSKMRLGPRINANIDARKEGALATFRGNIARSKQKSSYWVRYSRGIRQLWARLFSKPEGPIRITAVRPLESRESTLTAKDYTSLYEEDFLSAKFCLCPPGWASWTPRPFEAMFLGCVPVLVADDQKLPFSHFVDFNEFTISIKEAQANEILSLLQEYEKDLPRLRAGMEKNWQRFTYNMPPRPGDAFHHIAHELNRKRIIF